MPLLNVVLGGARAAGTLRRLLGKYRFPFFQARQDTGQGEDSQIRGPTGFFLDTSSSFTNSVTPSISLLLLEISRFYTAS